MGYTNWQQHEATGTQTSPPVGLNYPQRGNRTSRAMNSNERSMFITAFRRFYRLILRGFSTSARGYPLLLKLIRVMNHLGSCGLPNRLGSSNPNFESGHTNSAGNWCHSWGIPPTIAGGFFFLGSCDTPPLATLVSSPSDHSDLRWGD